MECTMSEHPVTLAVSDYIYNRAQQIAEATTESIEQVLARQLHESFGELSALPPEERTELAALIYLSDEALQAMAHERMPRSRQERMQALLDLNAKETANEAEQQELAQLIEQGDKLMLRKAQAVDILVNRGYTITADDMMAADE